jgi:hypothetical protein
LNRLGSFKRPLALGGAALATMCCLAACSNTGNPTPAPLGLGVTLSHAKHFYESMGGGPWERGAYTGGILGRSSSGKYGEPCSAVMAGTSNVNTLILDCTTSTNGTITQLQDQVDKTVHRFAPAATSWVTSQLATDAQTPVGTTTPIAQKTFNGVNVSITSGLSPTGGRLLLTLRPEAFVPKAATTSTVAKK